MGRELLRFNFAVLNEDNSLKMLIEYDGGFHDQSIMGESHLRYQQFHDRMKDLYCEGHNIKLIRIHYSDFDNIVKLLNANIVE